MRQTFISLIVASLVLVGVAGSGSAKDDDGPAPATEGRTQLLVEFDDRPAERREWFTRQRAYPFERIPADAYSAAAAHYLAARDNPNRNANRALPTAAWFEVGPAPMLNSIFGYGNVTGRISTIALHPSDPNIVLVGGSAGGIWRTENAQTAPPTWTPVGDNLPTLAIADIEFAPSNPSIVYAASGDDDVSMWGMGMFKSTDGGVTWARVDDGTVATGIPDGTYLSKIVVNFADSARVATVGRGEYTAGGGNNQVPVYVTADGGTTWVRGALPAGDSRLRELVGETGCPDNLWAVDYPNRSIIRSTDFGLTWQVVPGAGLPAFTSNTKMAVHRPSCAAPGRAYASVYSGGSLAGDPTRYAGVYVSTDDGANWALPGAVAGPSGGCLGQCGYDHEMVADPLDPNHVYLIGRDFWGSFDGGAVWTGISVGFPDTGGYTGGRMHVDMHAVEVWGTGPTATVWVGGDGGVWSYDVATDTFTNRVGNLATAELIDLALHPDTPNLAIGGLQDNGSIMYDGNIQWQAVLHGDGGYSGFIRNASGAGNPYDGAFTSYVYSTGYHSTNRGQNWTSFTNGATFNNEANEFYSPWVGTDNRLWHGAESLWYCDWPTQCSPFTRLGPNLAAMTGSSYISKLSIHMSAPGSYGPFYAATAYTRGFLQSDDGVTWQIRTGTLPNRYITRVAHDPSQPSNVWVTLSGFGTPHVFFSTNGGQTWQNRSGDLPNVPVNAIYIDNSAPTTTWMVGTDVGVYGTSDGGTTYAVVGTALPAVLVSDLEAGPDGLIYAATGGRSVWAVPCATPPTLNAAAAGDNQIDLTWTGAAGSYDIERSLGGCAGPFTPLATVNAPPFAFSDPTVSGGVPYGYLIRTVAGCGAIASVCVEATTTGACTLEPSFPGASVASGAGATCAITVQWPAATGLCGGPPVYNVYRSTDPLFTPGPTNLIASCLPDLSYVDTNVTSAQAYAYVVRAESPTAIPATGPCGGAEEANLVRITGTPELLHKTDFESGWAGWTATLGTPPASSGSFVLGDPDGTFNGADPAQPEDDHTVGGVNCLFSAPNPGGLGTDDIDDGEVIALSPLIDASASSSVNLSLWRWHYLRDLNEDDSFVIEVSNDDGGSWTQIDSVPASQSANAWTEVNVDLETFVPLTALMRLRVRASDGTGDGNIVESALDDIVLTSNQACSAPCATLIAVGNTLLAVRVGDDVDLQWVDPQPGLTGWSLYRSTDKTSTGAGVASITSPTHVDVGVVPGPPTELFYNVVALCGANEGPF